MKELLQQWVTQHAERRPDATALAMRKKQLTYGQLEERTLEQFEPDANSRENLYQHDMGVARLRRVFRTKAEAQLKALEAAGHAVQ